MRVPLFGITTFTRRQFSGNPATVIALIDWLPDAVMQGIAAESPCVETVFVVPQPGGRYHIRWFAADGELPFGSHATLACGHVIFHQLQRASPGQSITFANPATGDIPVTLLPDGRISMSVPCQTAQRQNQVPAPLLIGLGIEPREVWKTDRAYIAVYESQEQLCQAVPLLAPLQKLCPMDVCLTAPANAMPAPDAASTILPPQGAQETAGAEPAADYVCRYFRTGGHISEDAASAFAQTMLAPLWGRRLGKTGMVARQLSPRGGILYCTLEGERVHIAGDTLTYLEGELLLATPFRLASDSAPNLASGAASGPAPASAPVF